MKHGHKIEEQNLKYIKDKMTAYFLKIPVFLGIFFQFSILAAPWDRSNELDALRFNLQNQEVELRTFENKLESLNAILDSLNEQISTANTHQKELFKGNTNAQEAKVSSLESLTKALSLDIKQLRSHANDTSISLEQMKKKFSEWDIKIKEQNQNIDNLQIALQSLMEFFQAKTDASSAFTGKVYKVKDRDTLEKIAKAHGTTIQAIKEINNLNSDKIVVGKSLKIP